MTSARAMATRCCCPPDSSAGRCWRRLPIPSVAITSSIHAVSGRRRASVNGSVTFSPAVSVGTRLNDWKTKPIRSRRNAVSCRSDNEPSSVSPMKAAPLVNESRPARQCMSVDFPEPDGPMIAVKRPWGISTVTSSRATTAWSSWPYTFDAAIVLATGVRAETGRGRRAGGRAGEHARHRALSPSPRRPTIDDTSRYAARRTEPLDVPKSLSRTVEQRVPTRTPPRRVAPDPALRASPWRG